jgi:hypothetical protein
VAQLVQKATRHLSFSVGKPVGSRFDFRHAVNGGGGVRHRERPFVMAEPLIMIFGRTRDDGPAQLASELLRWMTELKS